MCHAGGGGGGHSAADQEFARVLAGAVRGAVVKLEGLWRAAAFTAAAGDEAGAAAAAAHLCDYCRHGLPAREGG